MASDGKVTIITGAGTGIGKGSAFSFLMMVIMLRSPAVVRKFSKMRLRRQVIKLLTLLPSPPTSVTQSL